MTSIRSWVLLGTVLALGASPLLPVRTAHAQEPFVVDVTVDSATIDIQTGGVTVSATVTCSEPTTTQLSFFVNQPVGRRTSVTGSRFFDALPCDPDGESYTVTVFADAGRFTSGRSVISASAFVCGALNCDSDVDQQFVRLRQPR